MVLKVQFFFLHPPHLYLRQAPAVNRPYIGAAPGFASQCWSYRAETLHGDAQPPLWWWVSPAPQTGCPLAQLALNLYVAGVGLETPNLSSYLSAGNAGNTELC